MKIITENNIIKYIDKPLKDGVVIIGNRKTDATLKNPVQYEVSSIPKYCKPNDWTYDGSKFECINAPTEKILADIAAKRYEEETKGITLPNSIFVHTDRATQASLTSALAIVGDGSIRWKLADGTWVMLDKTTLTTMANAVFAHVQKCFQREYELNQNPSIDWEW